METYEQYKIVQANHLKDLEQKCNQMGLDGYKIAQLNVHYGETGTVTYIVAMAIEVPDGMDLVDVVGENNDE